MAISEAGINVLGGLGGGLLGVCVAPQVWKIWRTRSARDISYTWSVAYTLGLAFNVAYLVLEHATVGWAFGILEVVLAFAVVLSKMYFDAQWKRMHKTLEARTEASMHGAKRFAAPEASTHGGSIHGSRRGFGGSMHGGPSTRSWHSTTVRARTTYSLDGIYHGALRQLDSSVHGRSNIDGLSHMGNGWAHTNTEGSIHNKDPGSPLTSVNGVMNSSILVDMQGADGTQNDRSSHRALQTFHSEQQQLQQQEEQQQQEQQPGLALPSNYQNELHLHSGTSHEAGSPLNVWQQTPLARDRKSVV